MSRRPAGTVTALVRNADDPIEMSLGHPNGRPRLAAVAVGFEPTEGD